MSLPTLLLTALWSLLLLAAFFYFSQEGFPGEREVRNAWLVVLLAAGLARLVPNFLLPVGAGYDIQSYQMVGNTVLAGEDVYIHPHTENRHPYLPLQMYWMAAVQGISRAFDLPFVQLARLAPIAADVGIAVCLYLFLKRTTSAEVAFRTGMLYAANPVSVFVSAYHGQFDALPALALLLSFAAVQNYARNAGGWLGLGILFKSWPVLALPPLVFSLKGWRPRAFFLITACLVPLFGLTVYLEIFDAQPLAVLSKALGYNWGVGVWGYTYFVRLTSILSPQPSGLLSWFVHYGRYLTLAALALSWLFKARHQPPVEGFLTLLVVFFASMHAFSIQYLMWLVPFALLAGDRRWVEKYTLAAFVYMFLAYNTLILENPLTALLAWPQADWFMIMPAGIPAWLVTAAWAARRLWAKPVTGSAPLVSISN